MKTLLTMLAGLTVVGIVSPVLAAKFLPPIGTAITVHIACKIEYQKVLVVTNTSGGVIPAGTRISYAYERMPDHAVRSGYFSGGAVQPGQVIKDGITPAFSCSAWFPRQLVNAPVR